MRITTTIIVLSKGTIFSVYEDCDQSQEIIRKWGFIRTLTISQSYKDSETWHSIRTTIMIVILIKTLKYDIFVRTVIMIAPKFYRDKTCTGK